MKRFIQVVLYAQMVFLAFAGVVGFLAHRFPIAAQEQALGRQVGFILLALLVTLGIVSRYWQREPNLLLIPIVFNIGGAVHHGFDALIVGARLGLPAPSGGDIYAPLVSDLIFLTLFLVGYARVRSRSQASTTSAAPEGIRA